MAASSLLTIMKDGVTLKTQPIQGEAVLGRGEGCAIRLEDRAISRQHAVFRWVGSHLQVENRSEFAPLSVNGAECTTAVLKEGDIVAVGPYLIRVSPSAEPAPAPQPLAPATQTPPPVSAPTNVPDLVSDAPVAEEFEAVPQDVLSEPAPVEGDPFASDPIEAAAAPNAEDPAFQVPQADSIGGLEANEALAQEGSSLGLGDVEESSSAEVSQILEDDGKTKVSSSSKVAVKLVFKPGAANVTEFEIAQDEVSIGRGKGCDIIIDDKKASRKNSIIKRAGMSFVIRDLESANGTFVNGAKITEQELSGDDVIRIGAIEFVFKAVSADYKSKEKDFLAVPVEEEIPSLDSEAMGISADPANALESPAQDFGALAGIDPVGQGQAQQGISLNTQASPNLAAGPAIPGITGISGNAGKKQTLLEKFKALPKRTQYIGIVAAILFLAWLNEDDAPILKKGMPKKKPSPTASVAPTGPATFESLPAEKKQYVEAQHTMAFDYYRNKEYDKALFEIEKIFTIIPDYKDSREIQRYAREGKRKMDAIEDERRKKEDEAKLKAKISTLVEETRLKMEKKLYDQAKEAFPEILSLDPDNTSVAAWKKEIDAIEEQKKMEEQQRQVEADINKRAWDLYKEAQDLKKEGKYHSAISTFQRSIDVGASDKKLIPLSKKMIAICHATIRKKRDPVLAEAKKLEEAGDFAKAFQLYKKATKIDPPHPAGYAGMNRVRGILHDRAKAIYTEAILAESYSDFTMAKKMFEECLQIAPHDDIYYERSQRKLSHYFIQQQQEGQQQ